MDGIGKVIIDLPFVNTRKRGYEINAVSCDGIGNSITVFAYLAVLVRINKIDGFNCFLLDLNYISDAIFNNSMDRYTKLNRRIKIIVKSKTTKFILNYSSLIPVKASLKTLTVINESVKVRTNTEFILLSKESMMVDAHSGFYFTKLYRNLRKLIFIHYCDWNTTSI